MSEDKEIPVSKFIQSAGSFMPEHQVLYHLHTSMHLPYLYVETPKVACSTIKRSLQEYEHEKNGTIAPEFVLENVHPRDMSPLLKIDDPRVGFQRLMSSEVYKWCVVRNPFSRVLSCYLDKVYLQRDAPMKRKVVALFQGVRPFKADMSISVSFEQFLEIIKGQSSFEMDAHWRIQKDHTLAQLIEFDKVCRFERLSDDLAQVSKDLGDPKLLKLRKPTNPTGASDLLAKWYQDPFAVKAVRDIYERDFSHFGYSTELQA